MAAGVNGIVSHWIRRGYRRVEDFSAYPWEDQRRIFSRLLHAAEDTAFGRDHGFSRLGGYRDFADSVPVRRYEDFFPYVERCLRGEKNVVWPNPIRYFSKSSGTTNAQSKYIPISRESLQGCHFQAARDLLATYLHHHPDARLFQGSALRLGGSLQKNEGGLLTGDLSAILMKKTPGWIDHFSTPSRQTALLADWNEKLPRMVEEVVRKNVTSLAGVPSWMLVMLEKVLEVTGAGDISQVWPNLELFMHGGIGFGPYQDIYQRLIPSSRMRYYEVYNASEGFFAFQDTPDKKEMLLMTDHGVFYEFIPMDRFAQGDFQAIPLKDVEKGINYAMVISTDGGLWRYLIGDTVRFTSTSPYRIVITGRTKQFINAFGEELMVENTEAALSWVCGQTGAIVREYSAAPVFMEKGKSGAHEWVVEFSTPPLDMEHFAGLLDMKLQELNSDYRAKRYCDTALRRLILTVAPDGTFHHWMASRGKMGGQNKVPRLDNSRLYVDTLKELING